MGGRDGGRMQGFWRPLPQPAAQRSFPWPWRADPLPSDPTSPARGGGGGQNHGTRALLCALRPPQTSGAGREVGGLSACVPHPPTPGCGGVAAAQAQSRCWEGVGTGLWLPLGTKHRGVGREPPTLRGEAPAFSTALPRTGEGIWLGEGAINICK